MLTAVLIVAALIGVFAWALCRAAARNTTFDEHAATACALLQPDNPELPSPPPSFIEQVEAYVAAHAPKES